jgi:hypothetical protein
MTGTYRIINGIIWLYLWLSDVMQPVTADGDFWAEKLKQFFRLNEHFDDPARLVGNAILPAVLWFIIDWGIRRKQARPVQINGKPDER